MTKVREIYRCQICGNVVEVVNPGAVLSCCGEPMKLMKENTSDGAKEKHVPVIEPIEGGYRVTVGSVEHPMLPERTLLLIFFQLYHGIYRQCWFPVLLFLIYV